MNNICNACGKTTLVPISCGKDPIKNDISATLYMEWCYGSDKDGTSEKAQICGPCFEQITIKFKIPTSKKNYFTGEIIYND